MPSLLRATFQGIKTIIERMLRSVPLLKSAG
jgi:hypothetical protein